MPLDDASSTGGVGAEGDDGADGADAFGSFADAVLAVVADIPAGRVATYGDVAAILGTRGARAVGRVMARSGGTVTWWRVIRAGGHPPSGHGAAARAQYEREGTPLLPADTEDGYRIDLAACRWRA
ncbi:MGMT family protein [Agromyces mediolanus]|uniref:MGMT family protein n=1 Tax=Agromyces mediolanus TaxID=41986 RepID=UPI0027E1A801|nr:MGMT family protein [Agromyces mediolanus]